MKAETAFQIRFATLVILIISSLGMLTWGVSRIGRTEALALAWAGNFVDTSAEALARAHKAFAFEQSRKLAVVAEISQQMGGEDLDVRMQNLQRFADLVAAAKDTAEASTRLSGTWSPVTWWENPVSGKKIALNATSDGRIDPTTITKVKSGLDLDIVVALARERAAQNAPLSPAEKVARDLAKLAGTAQ